MNIVRFKVVANCIGIRRSSIAYFLYENKKSYDVSSYEHPLNSLKTITIDDNKIIFLDKIDNNDVIPFKLKAQSLGKEIEETCYLDTKLMDINDNNIETIKSHFGEVFDEQRGEYEFIYAFYQLNKGNKGKAFEAFKESLDSGFKLASRYFNN